MCESSSCSQIKYCTFTIIGKYEKLCKKLKEILDVRPLEYIYMRTSNNILNSNMILYTDAIMQKSEGVKQGGLTLLRKNPMKSRFLERSFRARFNCFPIKNTFLKISK